MRMSCSTSRTPQPTSSRSAAIVSASWRLSRSSSPAAGSSSRRNFGADRDGARDADAPLLPVREGRGRHVRHAPEAEAVEQRPRALTSLAPREARAERAQLDVLEDRQLGKGRDVLERAHEPGLGEAMRRPGRHVPAAEHHLPGGARDEVRDGVHERRLARAVRPDQAHDLTLLERQIDTVDGLDSLEVDADLLRDQLLGLGAADGHRSTVACELSCVPTWPAERPSTGCRRRCSAPSSRGRCRSACPCRRCTARRCRRPAAADGIST